MRAVLIFIVGSTLTAAPLASAQSLFQSQGVAPAAPGVANYAEPLYVVSMFAIQPPKPRAFQANDLITIIVREESAIERTQEVTEEKEYENTFQLLNKTLLNQFLQFRLPSAGKNANDIDLVSSTTNFDGEGEYTRDDTIETRLTARVLEVKPNGTLLLEARTVTQTDQEIQSTTLSGLCRTADVTADNTILSTQIFGLNLNVQHEGQVRRATKKGIITRAIETLFNF